MYFKASFLLFGAILGMLFRQACGGLAFAKLLGKRELELKLRTLGTWGIILLVYPWSQHVIARPWYVFGLAAGIVIHKSLRMALARNAAAYRRILNIAFAWPPDQLIEPTEYEALVLLKRGPEFLSNGFTKLRRKLGEWESKGEGVYTKRLALISASVYRLEGNYAYAVHEALKHGVNVKEPEDVYLLLYAAINSAELGDKDQADGYMNILLESDTGKKCSVANIGKALWMAEAALAHISTVEATDEPLKIACQALEYRKELLADRIAKKVEGKMTISHLLGRFVEFGMPVTAVLFMDILGYTLLAAGNPEEAYVMFQRCVEIDPEYTGAYLHMGEYFLFRKQLGGMAPRPSESDLWHATACYRLAIDMERNEHSRIRSMAMSRYDKIREISPRDGLSESA